MNLTILPEHAGERLDRWMVNQNPEFSRSRIQKLITNGAVSVNGNAVKSNYRVTAGDQIVVDLPDPIASTIDPEDIPLDIFF